MNFEVDEVILYHMGRIQQLVQRYEMGIMCYYRQVLDYFERKSVDRIEMLVNYYHRLPICEPITALTKFMEFLKNMNYQDIFEQHLIKPSIMMLIDKFNQFMNLRLINGETNHDISYEMV